MKARVLIGTESQVRVRLKGHPTQDIIFDETMHLSRFILELEQDPKGEWNQYAIEPLAAALKPFCFNKQQLVKEACDFMWKKCQTNNAFFIYAALRIWDDYLKAKHFSNKKDAASAFSERAQLITLPFRRKIDFEYINKFGWPYNVNQIESKAPWPYLEQSRLDLWYPINHVSVECASAYLSFDPLITYYFNRLDEWQYHFRCCKVCGKYFFASSKRYTLCSDKCRKKQREKNKRKFTENAASDSFEVSYSNACQNWRNKINKAKKTFGFPEDTLTNMMSAYQRFRKEALKRKKDVKQHDADAKEFNNWLLMQDNVIYNLLYDEIDKLESGGNS